MIRKSRNDPSYPERPESLTIEGSIIILQSQWNYRECSNFSNLSKTVLVPYPNLKCSRHKDLHMGSVRSNQTYLISNWIIMVQRWCSNDSTIYVFSSMNQIVTSQRTLWLGIEDLGSTWAREIEAGTQSGSPQKRQLRPWCWLAGFPAGLGWVEKWEIECGGVECLAMIIHNK